MNIFIWLSSPLNLDKVFGLRLESPILTPFSFCLLSGIVIFLVAFYICFFKSEANPEKKEGWGLCETLKMMKGFYHNKNLLFLLIFFFSQPLTTAPIDNLSDVLLLKNGLSRNAMVSV